MMEKLKQRIARQSEVMVENMLDAIEEKLLAMFGEQAVERGEAEISLRAKDLAARRLLDAEMRFLMGAIR